MYFGIFGALCIGWSLVTHISAKILVFEATGAGDPYFDTLDGCKYEFQGLCRYYFCVPLRVPVDRHWEVSVEHAKQPGQERSFTKSVHIVAHNHAITLKEGGAVIVDGYDRSGTLPIFLHNDLIKINRINKGGRQVILVDCIDLHFQVEYGGQMNGQHRITFRLVGTEEELAPYRNNLKGLAGNFNGNGEPEDELTDPATGEQFSDPTEFGNSMMPEGHICDYL